MSASLNKVFLIGKLAEDPELKYTQKGTAVVEALLLTDRQFTAGDGHKYDKPSPVIVALWGRQAEVLAEYYVNGSPIFVEGRIDPEGPGVRVICEQFQFLDSGSGKREVKNGK